MAETPEQRRARQRAEIAERDRRAIEHARQHPITAAERADLDRVLEGLVTYLSGI